MTNKIVRFNPMYNFVRASQLEGTPLVEQEKGVAPYSVARTTKMFGLVTRKVWPYDSTSWPPIVPVGLDNEAAHFRVHCYLRMRNEFEIKQSLAEGFPVLVSVPFFAQWRSAENGVIQFPGQKECPVGMHAVLIVGYHDDNQYFSFQNSWGTNWGDDGFGWLPYGYFDGLGTEAIVCLPERTIEVHQNFVTEKFSISISGWGRAVPVRHLMHAVNIYDHETNEEIAWAFAFNETNSLDVEEFFVSPNYRKQGYARALFDSLSDLSAKINKPLKFWVPHIDSELLGQDMHDLAWAFNLRVEESPVRWAAKTLVQKM